MKMNFSYLVCIFCCSLCELTMSESILCCSNNISCCLFDSEEERGLVVFVIILI